MCAKNRVNASSPPADAPMPTTSVICSGVENFEAGRFRARDGAAPDFL
jgi:hypothetical protein